MTNDLFAKLTEKYPFITSVCVCQHRICGHYTKPRQMSITTIYDFGIHTNTQKSNKNSIELANVWWWESNQKHTYQHIPQGQIGIIFRPYLRTFTQQRS
jgi:hypothetical protein